MIKALTVQRVAANNYKVTATETINLVRDIPNYDDGGTRNFSLTSRQVTGRLVVGTAANPVLYVTPSDPRIGGGSGGENDLNLDTNSGALSRLGQKRHDVDQNRFGARPSAFGRKSREQRHPARSSDHYAIEIIRRPSPGSMPAVPAIRIRRATHGRPTRTSTPARFPPPRSR
ncbi:MAG TPA: hypothetical protein VL069_01980 [Opitutus sp.]|nr:hypothetical protein [Opitutus sp.]